jgi:hypothetical protein
VRFAVRKIEKPLFKVLRCPGRQFRKGVQVGLKASGAGSNALADKLAILDRVFNQLPVQTEPPLQVEHRNKMMVAWRTHRFTGSGCSHCKL